MGDSYLAQQAFGCKPDAFCPPRLYREAQPYRRSAGLAVSERPPS